MFEDYKDVLTAQEAREALSIGMNSMYKLLHEGKVKSIRIGSKFLIPKKFLVDFINSHAN